MIVRRFPTTFDRNIDRAFEQLTNSFFETRRPAGPVVDGAWRDNEYVLTVDLPGVPADAVSVELTGDTLSLEARTDEMHWQRTLRLGGRLDPDKVTAHHLDGRLTVRIGTYDEPEARKITIATTPPPAAIEAESSIAEDVEQSGEQRADRAQATEVSSAG